MKEALETWLARQSLHAREEMFKSISRIDMVKRRPGFGHEIRAARGSIIASPVLADWHPEPDYFFHWFRDSAIVIDALRLLYEAGSAGAEATVHLHDFVRFSMALGQIEGRRLVEDSSWRGQVVPEFVQYLREGSELEGVRGENVVAETRVNPDGTLDITSWTRPQHDGAALRALALLRWSRITTLAPAVQSDLAALLNTDLAFVAKNWRVPAFDMWEEERNQHYHTLCVSAAAMDGGARWLEGQSGDTALVQRYRSEAREIRLQLDAFWLPHAGFYASRLSAPDVACDKALDISIVFAAIHAWDGSTGPHTVADPRIHATLEKLMALFSELYPINRGRMAGPAMGRYRGDRYFSGGAYYFSTFGAAELCFRAAAVCLDAATWRARGDAFLDTIRDFTPASGDLSEQFDQADGRQTSARHLAWSYAAFISCIAARTAALSGSTR
ncbi:MAG: glycoside hydrolase family 15 protein [Steroidobacteraceae bacterium]